MTAISKVPKLAECSRDSFIESVMTCAQLGFEINTPLGHAYILPYKGVATLIIGYKGYMDLAFRSGQLSGFQAEAVYEKDYFEFRLGLNPKLEHIPADVEDRGALKYAYAVADLKGGGHVWRVLNRAQVMKAKASSPSAGSNYSPWKSHEEAMWRKTAIRALSSVMPLSSELRTAVENDADSHYENVQYSAAVTAPAEDVGDQIAAAAAKLKRAAVAGTGTPPVEEPTDDPKQDEAAGGNAPADDADAGDAQEPTNTTASDLIAEASMMLSERTKKSASACTAAVQKHVKIVIGVKPGVLISLQQFDRLKAEIAAGKLDSKIE